MILSRRDVLKGIAATIGGALVGGVSTRPTSELPRPTVKAVATSQHTHTIVPNPVFAKMGTAGVLMLWDNGNAYIDSDGLQIRGEVKHG